MNRAKFIGLLGVLVVVCLVAIPSCGPATGPASQPVAMEEESPQVGGPFAALYADPAFTAVPTKELPQYVLGQKAIETPLWVDDKGNTHVEEAFRYAGLAGQEKALDVFIYRFQKEADRPLYRQLVKDLASRLDAPADKEKPETWPAEFLGRLGTRDTLGRLLSQRKDPFDQIGRAMLTALSEVGDQRDVPLLIALAGREDRASAALVNTALAHMMAAPPLPLRPDGGTDAAAWQAWWDYRPGKGLLSRAEVAATQKTAMRKIEFMPEAFASIISPAKTRMSEMTVPSTQPGVPDKHTPFRFVLSSSLDRYVTLKNVWVGYSGGHAATLIDAGTGRRPKFDAVNDETISAVAAATPAMKAIMEEAKAIRARPPWVRWAELADLLNPGATVQDVELILAPLQFGIMPYQGGGWGYIGYPEDGVTVSVSNSWSAVDRRLPPAAWPIHAKPIVTYEKDTAATQPTSTPATMPATGPAEGRGGAVVDPLFDKELAEIAGIMVPRQSASAPAVDPELAKASAEELARRIVQNDQTWIWDPLNQFLAKTADKPALRAKVARDILARIEALRGQKAWSVCQDRGLMTALIVLKARRELLQLMEGELSVNTCCGSESLMLAIVAMGNAEDAWPLLRHFAKSGTEGWLSYLNGCMVRLTGAKAIPPGAITNKPYDDAFMKQAVRAWEDYLVDHRIGAHGVGYETGDDGLIVFLKDGDIKVEVAEGSKWFYRLAKQRQWKPIKGPATSAGMVQQLSASPGEKYLAVISTDEGHPAMDVFDLPAVLKNERPESLKIPSATDLFNYPEFMGWDKERLRVSSILDLTKPQPPEGKLNGEEMEHRREYLLDISAGKFIPAPQPATQPASGAASHPAK